MADAQCGHIDIMKAAKLQFMSPTRPFANLHTSPNNVLNLRATVAIA